VNIITVVGKGWEGDSRDLFEYAEFDEVSVVLRCGPCRCRSFSRRSSPVKRDPAD
jgi:hypothetical protein